MAYRIRHVDLRLNAEERNILAVAFKNHVAASRAAYRTLSGDEQPLPAIAAYKDLVARDIITFCDEILSLLNKHLLPAEEDPLVRVFYLKLAGDYYRYLAELGDKDAHAEALRNYESADEIVRSLPVSLAAADPLRLSLALNYACCCQAGGDRARAAAMAKDAFDSAVSQLRGLDEHAYKDAALLLQLLRETQRAWGAE
jgi:14-3-3 protein epsilon